MLCKPLYEYNKPVDPVYSTAAVIGWLPLYSLGHLLVLLNLQSWRHLLAHVSPAVALAHYSVEDFIYVYVYIYNYSKI